MKLRTSQVFDGLALRRHASPLWGGLLVLLAVQSAQARPPRRVSLQYTRGEQALACIDPVALARRVEQLTGPVLVAPASADATVEAHIEARSGGGFRARIQSSREGEDAHGERMLESDAPDCRGFDEALAFVIATTIDPDLTLERVEALFDPAATPEKQALLDELEHAPVPPAALVPKVPRVVRRPAPTAPVPPPARIGASVRALGVGLAGSSELDALALGPTVGLRMLVWRWLELGARARAMFGVKPTALESGEVRMQQLSAALVLCPRLSLRTRWTAAMCVGPELAILHAASQGLDRDGGGVLVGAGALLRPELTVQWTPSYALSVAAFVRLAAPKTISYRRGLVSQEVFSSSRAAVGGELSIQHTF